ncbi:hypothetical protein N3K66_006573 [Trichothecium roseum]|uniref:Uncharacterized protein n=1 Tax=Trichothecium roseum TaxID=47278 RepID=A0ACC0UXG4_9HYPO|nr:hypothetical protein N3K66_006573 [Trichothecium roseum]
MAIKGYISYYWFPVFSSVVWLGMLLGMLLWWVVDEKKRFLSDMEAGMTLPYISDIGAYELKPLFIAGSCVVTLSFDVSFFAERWLRHNGRLVPNRSRAEKVLVVLSIAFALVGTAGLILLSIFDTLRYPTLHDLFLLLFIGGYLISAIFICWEYQRLGIKNREHRHLRISFWIKLAFIIAEVALAVAFGVLTFRDHKDVAAYIEWVIAFVFTFYVLSYVVDLYPATRTKEYHARFRKSVPAALEETSDSALPAEQEYYGRNGHF